MDNILAIALVAIWALTGAVIYAVLNAIDKGGR